MSSQQKLYDPERLQKIGEILPGLCKYAEPGDEINLGLVGDPQFPDVYRGNRPSGVIDSIEKHNDATIINATIDGKQMSLSSTTIGAYDTWEFTKKGFDQVLKREEEKAARSERFEEHDVEFRGNNDLLDRIDMLEQKIKELELTQQTFRSTVVSTIKEVAEDVNNVSLNQGLETKFCGTLVGKYNDKMNIKHRGEEKQESLVSYNSHSTSSDNDKLSFFEDDEEQLSSDEE